VIQSFPDIRICDGYCKENNWDLQRNLLRWKVTRFSPLHEGKRTLVACIDLRNNIFEL
jgi:hypothetical protein